MAQFALKVQRHVSKGWRKEASKLGQLWDIVRNGQVVATKIPFIVTHWPKFQDIEMDPVSYIYRVRGNRKLLQMNDMLVGRDPASVYEGSALLEKYTVVSMRLLRDNIAIRTDELCQVYRPLQPLAAGLYSVETPLINRQILARSPTSTMWAFVNPPAPINYITNINVGITTNSSAKFNQPSPVPLTTDAMGWVISFAILPGVVFKEGDIFIDSDEDWYRVDRPYYQLEGATLNQLRATRVRA